MENVVLILSLVLQLQVVYHYDTLSVSAYTNLSGARPHKGLMASGQYTRPGVAACGPSYAFGTLFILPDGTIVVCLDRGTEITDKHLDIWMLTDPDGSETTALRFGRHTLTVLIIEFKKGESTYETRKERRPAMPLSKFHGVIRQKNSWITKITHYGKLYFAGPFPANDWGEMQAAIAHDKIVLKHKLDDLALNFPPTQPPPARATNLRLDLPKPTGDQI